MDNIIHEAIKLATESIKIWILQEVREITFVWNSVSGPQQHIIEWSNTSQNGVGDIIQVKRWSATGLNYFSMQHMISNYGINKEVKLGTVGVGSMHQINLVTGWLGK